MIVSAVTDFPEPDSPTTARVWPSCRSNDTSDTAVNDPNRTVRSRTDSSGVAPSGFDVDIVIGPEAGG